MKFIPTAIPDLYEIEPRVFGDHRGYFFESYSDEAFAKEGIQVAFKQDNESFSNAGVLRGLHFQRPPMAQGKLVRVQRGSVLDVAVDLRKGSPTYGQHHKVVLSGENKKMLWIPAGFAHGFATLEDHIMISANTIHRTKRCRPLPIQYSLQHPTIVGTRELFHHF